MVCNFCLIDSVWGRGRGKLKSTLQAPEARAVMELSHFLPLLFRPLIKRKHLPSRSKMRFHLLSFRMVDSHLRSGTWTCRRKKVSAWPPTGTPQSFIYSSVTLVCGTAAPGREEDKIVKISCIRQGLNHVKTVLVSTLDQVAVRKSDINLLMPCV